MSHTVEVSRVINASPEAVYAAIADVTRMGEWSTECVSCTWHEGVTGPAVGATFDGHNRNGEHEWVTQGTVVTADPGRAFVFECSMRGFHFSTWGYTFEPVEAASGTACRVTEWADDFRPESALEFSARMSGVPDRTVRNHETISTTLERLAAALEA